MRTSPDTLTNRQAKVLDFILDSLGDRGFPPTVAEIAGEFGFQSPNAAASHLNALRKKGYIRVEPRASRGIEVLRGSRGTPQSASIAPTFPIIGRVAAGSPILAEESIEGSLTIDPSHFRHKPDYLLRVYGDSMIDVGIFEDDLVVVHKTQDVKNDDIVVANVNGDVTVKRLRRKGKRIELLPENKKYKPLVVDPDETSFSIEGLCVGVIRAV